MDSSDDPVLVYTLGKTGSTSVIQTIVATGRSVFQVHRLDPADVDDREREIRRYRPHQTPHHLWAAQHFRTRLPTPERPWSIVTLTRDPLAQNVSSFFQGALRRGYVHDQVERMLDAYLTLHNRERVLEWFDTEFRRHLGIDMYDHPFTPGEPLFLDMPHIRLLVMRSEDLNQIGPGALSKFTGQPISHMEHANVGARKGYADAYRRFRSEAELPAELIERMYESRYARHFYTPEEIDKFRTAWRIAK